MNKKALRIAGWALGLSLAVAGVGLTASMKDAVETKAATIGTHLTQVTEITSGNQYVIVGNNSGYALPTNPTVSSGKVAGTAIASVPDDGSGYLWTITKSGNYYIISDGTNNIYHSNGGSSGTNLTYGNSTTYKWKLEYSKSHWTFTGVNNTTENNRGMLCNSTNFGGYALSNETSYGYMNIYEVSSTSTYTVTYKANGGQGNDVVRTEVNQGSYELESNPFTAPSGKTFVGWKVDNAGQSYSAGASYNLAADTVFYAQWADLRTVTYKANGGQGNDIVDSHADGSDVEVRSFPFSAPEGKVFDHWNTAANDGGTTYLAGSTIQSIGSNMTLHAQYVNAYSVTYNANGGTGTLTDPASPYKAGSNVTVLDNTFTAPTGKSFLKWNTASDGTGIDYNPGATLSSISSNTILYAQWMTDPDITLNMNSFAAGSYDSNNDGITVSGIDFNVNRSYRNNNGIQIDRNSNSGCFYNDTDSPLGLRIIRVAVTMKTNTAKLYFGTSANPSLNEQSFSSKDETVFEPSGDFQYLKVTATSSYCVIDSLKIWYAPFVPELSLTQDSFSFTEGDSTEYIETSVSASHFTDNNAVVYSFETDDHAILDPNDIVESSGDILISADDIAPGTVTVTVTGTYSAASEVAEASFTITCNAATRNLTSYAINPGDESNDVLFESGEVFTIGGLVVTGTFDAAPLSGNITSECSFELWNSADTAKVKGLVVGTTTLDEGVFVVHITHGDLPEASPLKYEITVVALNSADISVSSFPTLGGYGDYDGSVSVSYGNSLASSIDLKTVQFMKGSQSGQDCLQTNSSKTDPCLYNVSAVPGIIRRITITALTNNNAVPNVHMATNAVASTSSTTVGQVSMTNMTGSIEVPLSSEYRYFYLDFNYALGASYMTEISIEYVPTDSGAAKNFEDHFLKMQAISTSNKEDTGACYGTDGTDGFYAEAKTAFGKLTPSQKAALSSDALARLKAWADANQETFDPSTGTFTAKAAHVAFQDSLQNSSIPLVATIATLGTGAAIGFFLFRRKRKLI